MVQQILLTKPIHSLNQKILRPTAKLLVYQIPNNIYKDMNAGVVNSIQFRLYFPLSTNLVPAKGTVLYTKSINYGKNIFNTIQWTKMSHNISNCVEPQLLIGQQFSTAPDVSRLLIGCCTVLWFTSTTCVVGAADLALQPDHVKHDSTLLK